MNRKLFDGGIGLPPPQFTQAFPFHLAIDQDLITVQAGPSLLRVCPDVAIGADIRETFLLLRPEVEVSYCALVRAEGSVMFWQHRNSGLTFRGQLLSLKEPRTIVFLWSPWLEDYAQFSRNGLLIDDFPIHDQIIDILPILESHKIDLQDERDLANKLIEQRSGLLGVNDELSRQFGLMWDEMVRLKQEKDETEKIALITNRTDNPMVITDGRGSIEWVNDAFTYVTGYPLPETIGKTPGSLLQGKNSDPEVIEYMRKQFEKGESFSAEIINYSKSGREYWIQLEAQPIKDEDGQITNWMAIEREITDRKQYEMALLAAKREAEAANRAKSAFVAMMSHEIRTPLNAVLGIIELLMDSQLDEEQELWAKSAFTAAQSLLNIINDILDFSKIEAGKLNLQSENFELKALIDEVIQFFRIRTEAKGLGLSFAIDPDCHPTFRGDPFRLRQILINLIDNAIKFTDHGGIFVSVSCQGSQETKVSLRIDIKDTGIGISADAQGYLFKQFVQLETSTSRRYGGSGLGLAICKRLATMMGGDIGVNSRLGEGSDFWFTAQLEKSTDSLIHPVEPFTVTLPTPDEILRVRKGASKNGELPPLSQKNRRCKTAKILVAEDGKTNLMVVKAMLEKADFQVDVAEDGIKAFESARAGNYDLIIMDVQMPKMDGYQATEAIRGLPNHRAQVPILAFTANALEENHNACLMAGMNDFIIKPVDKHRLLATVSRWLRKGVNSPAPVLSAADSNPPDLLDEVVLQSMASSTNDKIMRDTVAIFLTEAATQMERMAQALARKDYRTLEFEAHRLKGAAMTTGALRLAIGCRTIESACAEGNVEIVSQLSTALKEVFEETHKVFIDRGFLGINQHGKLARDAKCNAE